MLSCIADASPLRLAHGLQSLLVAATRAVLRCLQGANRDESCHASARTWAMVFHTSPRCNNGMLIHLLSERFALYYTLFSNDVFRFNRGISHFETFHCLPDERSEHICRFLHIPTTHLHRNVSSAGFECLKYCLELCPEFVDKLFSTPQVTNGDAYGIHAVQPGL